MGRVVRKQGDGHLHGGELLCWAFGSSEATTTGGREAGSATRLMSAPTAPSSSSVGIGPSNVPTLGLGDWAVLSQAVDEIEGGRGSVSVCSKGRAGRSPEAHSNQCSLAHLRATGLPPRALSSECLQPARCWIGQDACVSNYRSLNRTTSQLHPSKMPNCRLQIWKYTRA